MARRPAPPQSVRLSAPQMTAAIARFKRRIGELKEFEPTGVQRRSDPKIKTLEVAIDESLSEVFGHDTPEYQRYARAAGLAAAGMNMNGTPHDEVIEGLIRGKDRAIALLEQAIRSFEEKIAELGPGENPQHVHMLEAPEIPRAAPSRDVFIVHGHDGPAKIELARLIERAGLNAVILDEQPNAGRTIIEKFEDHGGAAGFAVVLLTSDDVGGSGPEQLQPRARQNVIGEMFWFAGKLGRDRVCALVKGEIEMPSDFAGVGYTDMDDRGAWKTELLRELAAAGYQVDWGKALA